MVGAPHSFVFLVALDLIQLGVHLLPSEALHARHELLLRDLTCIRSRSSKLKAHLFPDRISLRVLSAIVVCSCIKELLDPLPGDHTVSI